MNLHLLPLKPPPSSRRLSRWLKKPWQLLLLWWRKSRQLLLPWWRRRAPLPPPLLPPSPLRRKEENRGENRKESRRPNCCRKKRKWPTLPPPPPPPPRNRRKRRSQGKSRNANPSLTNIRNQKLRNILLSKKGDKKTPFSNIQARNQMDLPTYSFLSLIYAISFLLNLELRRDRRILSFIRSFLNFAPYLLNYG